MREMLRDAGWRYAIGLTVLMLILTSLPYTFAYLTAPDDLVFTGVQLNAADHAEYFAWMRAHEESFFIRNWMTPEPNEPVFFNLLWWAMAQFARLTGLDYAAVYQLLRWASALVFALVVYGFCRLCIEGRARRLLAFTLVMLAAGFGWALVAQKSLQGLEDVPYPLALYVPEANSFLAILGYPHFVIAAAHIVAVFALYLVALKRRQLRWAALAGVVALALGLQHAYDLVTVYGVLGAFVLALMLRERRLLWFEIGALAVLGVISVGPPAYFFLLTSADPVWREILDQFVLINVWTPGPIQLVVLMGALLLLGFAGPLADLWRARRANPRAVRLARGWLALTLLLAALTLAASLAQSLWPETFATMPVNALGFATLALVGLALAVDLVRPRQDREIVWTFVKTWALVHLAIIYIPIEFQIHLLNPWQAPLAVLAAAFWLDRVSPWLRARAPRLGSPAALAALLLVIVIPTNLYLFAWRFIDLRRYSAEYFLKRDEAAALTWLESNAAPEDVVLSSVDIGRFVPGMGGSTAFAAHYAMTLDYENKTGTLLPRFFDAATDDAWRETLVRAYNVRYLFYGDHERALGGFDPEGWPALESVFSQGGTTVYQVTLPAE